MYVDECIVHKNKKSTADFVLVLKSHHELGLGQRGTSPFSNKQTETQNEEQTMPNEKHQD